MKGDNRILGLAWNKERADKLIKGVNSLLAPYTQIEDYDVIELHLPPFSQWIEDKLEELGTETEVPPKHIVFNQKRSAHPGIELLQVYMSTAFDPMAWAVEILEGDKDVYADALGMTVPARERVEKLTR